MQFSKCEIFHCSPSEAPVEEEAAGNSKITHSLWSSLICEVLSVTYY